MTYSKKVELFLWLRIMPWSEGKASRVLKFGTRSRSGQLDAPASLSPKKVPRYPRNKMGGQSLSWHFEE